jgi:hypothetical protein
MTLAFCILDDSFISTCISSVVILMVSPYSVSLTFQTYEIINI